MRRAAKWWGLVAVLVVTVSLTACSSTSPKGSPAGAAQTSPTTPPAPTTTATTVPTLTSFTLAEPEIAAFGTDPLLPVEARDGAHALLDQYLDRAVVTPLRSGLVGDLAPLFTAPALERLSGPDRAAMIDEGLGGATDISVATAAAQLTALVGPEGVHVIVAGIDLAVTAKWRGGPVAIHRSGELTLVVDGDAWKISGYDVRVDRDGPQ